MVMKFTNNATTTLASSITSIATSLTVAGGGGALFPTLTASDYFYCTLANSSGTIEIIKVTARSTDTFTITRAQDNTVASAFTAGDKVELRLVAASLNDLPKLDEANTFSAANTFSTTLGVTGAATLSSTLGVTGVSTLTAGAVIQGMTVGKGAGAVATNTAVGASALQANTTGQYNTAIGYQASYSNTTANGSTAVGNTALYTNTGANNVGIGNNALYYNTTGGLNVAVGTQALQTNTVSSYNVAIGYQAGYVHAVTSPINAYSTYLGAFTGYSTTTGAGNTFLGANAGGQVTTGTYNVIVGGYQGGAGSVINATGSNFVVLSDGTQNVVASAKTAQSFALENATPKAGTGITFPATQSASTDANTLDDYEEGTWTPSLGGTSTGTFTGTYVKVGKLVTLYSDISVTLIGTGSTTQITGIPFTAAGGGSGSLTPSYTVSLATAIVSITAYLASSTIYIASRTAAAASGSTNAIFGNGTSFSFSCTYIATA